MKKSKTNENFDFIVVGGGIAGLSCLYWLKKLHKGCKIALIEKGKILDTSLDTQFCNLTVGSLGHYFNLYNKHGVDAVLKAQKFITDNLDLLESELDVLDRNPYVSLYAGGTINHLDQANNEQLGSFQSFVYDLLKHDLPLEEIKSDKWQYGVRYSHDGNYEAKKFIQKVWSIVGKNVEVFEKSTCKTINRELDGIRVVTAGGDEIYGKKMILANSNSIDQLIPEVREKVKKVKGKIIKFEAEINNLELVNYASQTKNGFFMKLIDGFYYGEHEGVLGEDSEFSDEKVKSNFQNFSSQSFPGAEPEGEANTTFLFSSEGSPLSGQSERHPNLYYLGAFSGQSKLYAFKLAKDLIIKISA